MSLFDSLLPLPTPHPAPTDKQVCVCSPGLPCDLDAVGEARHRAMRPARSLLVSFACEFELGDEREREREIERERDRDREKRHTQRERDKRQET